MTATHIFMTWGFLAFFELKEDICNGPSNQNTLSSEEGVRTVPSVGATGYLL